MRLCLLLKLQHQEGKMPNDSHSPRPHPPALVGFCGFLEDKDFMLGLRELCWQRSVLGLHQQRETPTVLSPYCHLHQVVLATRTCMDQDLQLGELLLGEDLEAEVRGLDWQPKSNVSRRRP